MSDVAVTKTSLRQRHILSKHMKTVRITELLYSSHTNVYNFIARVHFCHFLTFLIRIKTSSDAYSMVEIYSLKTSAEADSSLYSSTQGYEAHNNTNLILK